MAKWANSNVLDSGINYIKSNATHMLLISSYAAGDSYATVVANKVVDITMTGTDYTLSSSGNNRVLTVTAGKSGAATVTTGASPDLHIAFTDGTANVIWVTDETSNQPITSGNTVTFPAITYTANQPV